MKSRKVIFIPFAAALFFFIMVSSCSKKLNDGNPGNSSSGKLPVITVPDAKGTDTVITKGYFEVDVKTDTLTYCQLDVLVEGSLKYSKKGNSHHFIFIVPVVTFEIDQGLYKTVLNAYSYPASKSTAGILGNGQLMATKSIILIYLKDPVPFTPDLTFSNSQGTLLCRLNTPQSDKPVSKILVEKSVGPVQQFYPLYSLIGSSPFIFSDSTYVGEKADFRVTTYFSNAQKTYFFPQNIGVVQKNRETAMVSYSIDNDGYPVVQWSKTAYPADCRGYRIFNVFPGVKKEVATIPTVDQTTYTLNDVPFPGESKVYVSSVPKGPPAYYNDDLAINEYSNLDTVAAGIPSFTYWYFYSPVGDDFFTVDHEVITGYSVSTLAITHQIPAPVALYCTNVSPNNKYLLSYAFANGGFKYIFYHIPSKTLTYVPANLVDPSLNMVEDLAISDNGIGVIGFQNSDAVLYDFNNNKILSVLQFFDNPAPEVSPNGDYFFIKDGLLHLYKNDNGTVTEIWHSEYFDDYYIYYSFLPWDGGKAVIITGKVCSVKNSSDWTLVSSFPVDFVSFSNADFNRGTIMGGNGQYIQIVDFNSGSILKAFYPNSAYSGYVRHSVNNLFSGLGKRLVFPYKSLH